MTSIIILILVGGAALGYAVWFGLNQSPRGQHFLQEIAKKFRA
jgi:hypothetical protein